MFLFRFLHASIIVSKGPYQAKKIVEGTQHYAQKLAKIEERPL